MSEPHDTVLVNRPQDLLRTIDLTAQPRVGALPVQPAGHPAGSDALSTGPIDLTAPVPDSDTAWLPRYVTTLVALDSLAMLLGGLLGFFVRFDSLDGDMPLTGGLTNVTYTHVLLVAVPLWVLTMVSARTYEARFLGLGSEEFRRIANAAAYFTAVVAMLVFLLKLDIARGVFVITLPAAAILTLMFRFVARKILHRIRTDGLATHRVLVVGSREARGDLVRRLRAAPHSGLHVVGVAQATSHTADGTPSIDVMLQLASSLKADTIAVTYSPEITPSLIRELAWSLEGTGISLLVAPALTDVAVPRVSIRPVSGVPLLMVAEPVFTGWRKVAKAAFDVVAAGLGLLLISPVLAVLALAVRLSGPGPVLFRQTRIGKDGKEFRMFKFRSMVVDAESRLADLREQNDHGDSGVLFKMREDPRVTPVGRILRRYSFDELPQLFNVVLGHMSLVGPRPPLPAEVAQYERSAHRRLLVKPGMTGLWQVSGRSDLAWDESVRLDLYYVENWSITLDTEIIAKTALAVARGSGAH